MSGPTLLIPQAVVARDASGPRLAGKRLNALDSHRPTETVQEVARLNLFGHFPALPADPERMT